MAAKQITIQLRVDCDNDPEKFDHILTVAKQAAKHLIAMATLVAERKPAIALMTDDMFVEQAEIDILEDTLTSK